ncbi:MAG: FAD-dependent monooxygenase [Pseudomonadota bacterium]
MKVVIAGGGIGGLAAALALHAHGHEVQVLEQAPELTEIGAGLQISPNGWRVLDALGVTEKITETAFFPEAIEMRLGESGKQIFRLEMATTARKRWGAPYIQIHRADLHRALATVLEERFPGALRTGATFDIYAIEKNKVEVYLTDGETLIADLLVGADGLHSNVRAQMMGPDLPRYTGFMAWRALAPVEVLGDLVPPPTACVWVGQNQHAVTTRIHGGKTVNFVGMVERPEPAQEGWRIVGERADALADFEGWDPRLEAVLKTAEKVHCWALFDRAPLPQWHERHVVLLGDAAHPMLPSMAQGAVQALEDAWVLAASLGQHPIVEESLSAYFAKRIGRASRVQSGSASNARMFHQASGLGKALFYGPMSIAARLAPWVLHRRQDWVYGYDPIKDMKAR